MTRILPNHYKNKNVSVSIIFASLFFFFDVCIPLSYLSRKCGYINYICVLVNVKYCMSKLIKSQDLANHDALTDDVTHQFQDLYGIKRRISNFKNKLYFYINETYFIRTFHL